MFVKITIKKCFETNADIYMVLLKFRSTLISPRLPSLAVLLFNRQTRSILSKSVHTPCYVTAMKDPNCTLRQASQA